MEFIKNKEQFLENANEIIGYYNDKKEIVESIETLIFSFIELMCTQKQCADEWQWETIENARRVKELFNNIELIERKKQ